MDLLRRLSIDRGTFDGRVAVVTGAARGLGEQVARGLAWLGADTILVDNRPEGQRVADEIAAQQGRAEFRLLDLRDEAALEAFQRTVLASRGRVDILVNNAARMAGLPLAETPMELWDDLYRTTVRASAFLISKFLPGMRTAGQGVIANTVGAEGLSNDAPFSFSMVGQRSMVLSLAGEATAAAGVSVFGFAPGVMDTLLWTEDRAHFEKYYGMTLEEYVRDYVDNPGYDGLMPPDHAAASYIYCLAHAREYHGQIADAFHPLISHGIIVPDDTTKKVSASDKDGDTGIWATNDYLQGISILNRNLEMRIEERTRKLEDANRQLAEQKRYIEDISARISRYIPQQLYQSIFRGEIGGGIESRRKYLTVFFSDIRDFTVQTERLEPEGLSEILNNYFSAMTEIARAHGATIDKFIGDAILAFFGEPETEGQERDAARCIEMAVEMQRRMATMGGAFTRHGQHDPLEIRIGINSGYCTVGNFGSFERMDYTIIGSPVNLAARLQAACPPGGILVSANTFALAGQRFNFVPRGSLQLKGITGPVETYEVSFDRSGGGDKGAAGPLEALREQLARIDPERLGEAERRSLLELMAKLVEE
ncbi:SDR family NAD(P)-dependent oxidoreductase [Limibaculum sp. FT325]|uniref:SDR family NAD(P)-dependent oxidoreductase n=1 Tax=Thermohalobaculum sediminis TaxID=2939436 RepID=UPI0020BFF0C1|nr:SDR family NAD(P)-dependent oxidoreductase [Limibaculum sediminis]MCL5776151.1 SDR family NAD(P)-dependent oxidoreductase [Limibaculum sediminis]